MSRPTELTHSFALMLWVAAGLALVDGMPLVQMGQGRGGLNSYDWLENILGCDIRSAARVVPELQDLRVGDTVPLCRRRGRSAAR